MIFIQTNDPAPWIMSDSKDELLAIARIVNNTFGEQEYFESVFHDVKTDAVIAFAIEDTKLAEIITPIKFIGDVEFDDYHENGVWRYVEHIENKYDVDLAILDKTEAGLEEWL